MPAQHRAPHIAGAPSADIGRLSGSSYDVVIIGGGINGAAIARETARHGFRVLLLEKEDFGWGTTWRSTKLIHGGLRYLEHREFALVFESLRDQAALLREYPQMVRPLSFLLPVYEDDRHRPVTVNAGLTLYDLLSRARRLPGHRRLSRQEAVTLEPALRKTGLKSAFTYFDCQAAYPERLCLTSVLEACEAGTDAINHAEVVDFLVSREAGGRVRGLVARSGLTGGCAEIEARLVINAAGPWVDQVLGTLDRKLSHQLGGTKGAHLIVEYGGRGPLFPIYAETRSDHRPFFIIPWRNHHLISTTDTLFTGNPDDPRATPSDVAYLLSEAEHLLPGAPLSEADALYAYAGVRPLAASDGVSEGAISRRHFIRDHADDGHPGLLSIIGGKLSTYRSLAAQACEQIQRRLTPIEPAITGLRDCSSAGPTASGAARVAKQLGPAQLDYFRRLYGPRLASLLCLLEDRPALGEPLCPHGPDVEAQVTLAVRLEGARTIGDALLRRSGAGWNPCHGLDCARRVAALMSEELGWEAAEVEMHIARYETEVRRTFTRLAGGLSNGTVAADPGHCGFH